MGEIIRKTKGGRFLGWYLRYVDSDGKRKQRASHQPSRELARRMLVEIEARVVRGQVGMAEPATRALPAPTVSVLIERFLQEYSRPKIKDLASYRVHARKNLRRVLPLLGNRPADAVTSDEIARARDAIARSHAPASVRMTLAFLGTVFSWAVQKGLLARSPLTGVERPSAATSLEFFRSDEITALLQLAFARAEAGTLRQRLLLCCVHLALHTGLRKGELLGLRWQDLDLETRRLTVARSYAGTPKSNRARHLRLPSECVPLLQKWQAACPPSAEGLVFPVIGGGTHTSHALLGLPRLLTDAGCRVPAQPWHALRHTFASHFIMRGGNILTLQKILGHSDVKMTMIYAHLAPEYLADEMERLKFR